MEPLFAAIFAAYLAAQAAVPFTFLRDGHAPNLPAPLRFLLIAPFLVMNILIPMAHFEGENILIFSIVSFLLAWLANMKLLGLACRRGPLLSPSIKSFYQFTLALYFPLIPITVRRRTHARALVHEETSVQSQCLLALVKFTALCTILLSIAHVKTVPYILHFELVLGLYGMLSVLFDTTSALAPLLLGFPILEPFRNPFVMFGFADMWQRWNLVAGSTLREMIYEPIVEGALIRHSHSHLLFPSSPTPKRSKSATSTKRDGPTTTSKETPLRRAIGLVTVFFVCGVLHELIFYMLTRIVDGSWFFFFTAQGPIILAEQMIKRRVAWRPPRLVGILTTILLQYTFGDFYFIRPAIRVGLAHRVTLACADVVRQMSFALLPRHWAACVVRWFDFSHVEL